MATLNDLLVKISGLADLRTGPSSDVVIMVKTRDVEAFKGIPQTVLVQ